MQIEEAIEDLKYYIGEDPYFNGTYNPVTDFEKYCYNNYFQRSCSYNSFRRSWSSCSQRCWRSNYSRIHYSYSYFRMNCYSILIQIQSCNNLFLSNWRNNYSQIRCYSSCLQRYFCCSRFQRC